MELVGQRFAYVWLVVKLVRAATDNEYLLHILDESIPPNLSNEGG